MADINDVRREPFEPTWALIKKPRGYPNHPQNGKIEMIYNTNSKSLYHRLSPYTDHHQGLLSWGKQPFFWVYPDEHDKGLASLRKYDSRLFPIGSAPIDVVRVSKFMVSGAGVGFMAKQFLLQTASPYNERRIYNPTSPIVAAGMSLTLGSARPQRSFDTSGGLLGIARSVLGDLGEAIFGAPKSNPVSGTALANNPDALPTATLTTGAKGLIRAGTAERAKAHLDNAWPATANKGGFSGGFLSAIKGFAKSLFQNFLPQTQSGVLYRSDESAYGLMLSGATPRFNYDGNSSVFTFGQLWYAGGKVMRKNSVKVVTPTRLFVNYSTAGTYQPLDKNVSISLTKYSDILRGYIGYSPRESTNERKPGQRYGDAIGIGAQEAGESYTASDIVYQYSFYLDPSQGFPTKNPDRQKDDDAIKINTTLQKVLAAINKSSDGLYAVDASNDVLMRSGKGTYDYNRLANTNKRNESPKNFPLGALKAYRDSGVPLVDVTIGDDVRNNYKLPTNGTVDAINTLEVLGKDRKINDSKVKGWTTWEPYKDDLIACFFYDIVNEKYIPFRASIGGLSESGNASWEEMPFIGRADRVYSYGGFSRSGTFNLKVVIGSLAELIPTWQRINYICTAYKPSNYTKTKYNNVTDRFMVPPMFMLTIGDMYRDQPILIQSITITIPDDASWETYNQDNSGTDWSYLGKVIKSNKVPFAQLPREIELGFSITFLEKERAVVGGANFGHAPRSEDFSGWNLNSEPSLSEPQNAHKKLVVSAKDLPNLK